VKNGDHVITTSMEHNSVMRPLMFLMKEKGIELTVVQCDHRGRFDVSDLSKVLQKNTKAVIINHGSNVIGTVQPIGDIKQAIGDLTLIVDACQTIGTIPIDIK